MLITPDFSTDRPFDKEMLKQDKLIVAYLSKEEMNSFLKEYNIDTIVMHTLSEPDPIIANTATQNVRYTFSIVDILNFHSPDQSHDRIGLYLDKNRLIIVDIEDKDQSTKTAICKSLEDTSIENMDFGKILYHFFYTLIQPHNQIYGKLQRKIETLDNIILKNETPQGFSREIMTINHELLELEDYYDQLVDVIEVLADNENGLLQDQNLHFLRNLSNRIERYSNNNDLLRNYLTQVRDAYDSLINLNLNETMQTFTTITVIFSPLTLIAGWYGMNFKYMPELSHRFGYLYVIFISLVVVTGIVYIMKKKKLL